MKHEFTEDDLRQALRHTAYMDDGLRINIPAWVEDNDEVDTGQVDVFRAILDALPEPVPVADEWEQCEFSDIRKGDRVTRETAIGRTEFNGTVQSVHDSYIALDDGTIVHREESIYRAPSKFFRIPAPVQHPDPEQHPVIMGVVTRHGSNHDFGVRNWSNYHVYSDGQSEGFLNSDQITDWEPAKIVRIEEK